MTTTERDTLQDLQDLIEGNGTDDQIDSAIQAAIDHAVKSGDDETHKRLVLFDWLRSEGSYDAPDDVVHAYDDVFTVGPHVKYRGMSPAVAIDRVKLLRDAFAAVDKHGDYRWVSMVFRAGQSVYLDSLSSVSSVDLLRTAEATDSIIKMQEDGDSHFWLTYPDIEKAFRNCPACAELLKVGTHSVLNTLFLLTGDTSTVYGAESGDDVQTLREAFDGQTPADRRKSYESSDSEYAVLTDEEADNAWDESLDDYIDDCLEIPEEMQNYFDRDAWKRDAKFDGRGHSLGSYDGEEIEHRDLFIYRVN